MSDYELKRIKASDWLTIDQAALYVNVSVHTIHRLVDRGHLALHRPFGQRVVIEKEALDWFLRTTGKKYVTRSIAACRQGRTG